MAQISLREYDVKQMFAKYSKTNYSWIQIRDISDIEKLDASKKYVLKPDMLFGKRGKRGMVGIQLSKHEAKAWLADWYQKEVDIDGVIGTLDVFLAEEMLAIQQEYYLSFAQSREGDIVTFSPAGGVDIEENWESTKSIVVKMSEELGGEQISFLLKSILPDSPHPNLLLKEKEQTTTETNAASFLLQEKIVWGVSDGEELWWGQSREDNLPFLISSLFHFYRTHGFTSLEFNPIAQDTSGKFHLLDAVAKIDDCEHFLQKEQWSEIEFPNNFGFQESAAERYIRELDMQTGASLKLKILNPNAAIWTLFAGGGGSLVMTDSLGALGYAGEIWNYGELSGNPTREFTREYVRVLLREMLKAQPETQKKYLIIAGAIANFTDITTTFQGVIDILEELQEKIRAQKIEILVRRGGINEKKWLSLLSEACERLKIPALITGSDTYMTDILKKIIL